MYHLHDDGSTQQHQGREQQQQLVGRGGGNGGSSGGSMAGAQPAPAPPAAKGSSSSSSPSSSYVEMTEKSLPTTSPTSPMTPSSPALPPQSQQQPCEDQQQQHDDQQPPHLYHHAPWWSTTWLSSRLTTVNINSSGSWCCNDGGLASLPSFSSCSCNSCCCGSTNHNNPSTTTEGLRVHHQKRRFESFWNEFTDLVKDLVEYGRQKTWKKKIMTMILCVSSTLVFYDLLFGSFITTKLHEFILWTTLNPHLAVLSFITIFVVSTLIFIPPVLLVFGAGYAFTSAFQLKFGVLIAILTCFVGSTIGAVLCFVRSRYMMRDLIYLFARRYPLVRAADRALKQNGLHLMLLLRSCPMIPFNGLNHCCGVTGVSLHDFTVSLVGILPYQIYTIMLGATTATLGQNLQDDVSADDNDKTRAQLVAFIVVMTAGTLFGLIAMVYAWRAIKHELKKELHLSSEEFEHLVHPNTNTTTDNGCCGGGGGGGSDVDTTEVEAGDGDGDPTCSYVGGPATGPGVATGPAPCAAAGGGGDGLIINGSNNGLEEDSSCQPTLGTNTTDFDFHLQQQQPQQQQHHNQTQGGEGSDDYGIEAGIYRDDDEKWYWVWA